MSYRYKVEELRFIAENRKTMSGAELAAAFNSRFEHNKSVSAINSVCKVRGWDTGRTGQFQKGDKPFNAGTKGLMKPNSTSFKKGLVPINLKPVGSERIDKKDGYTWVKTAEPNQWRQKHVLNWEAEHGPIPDGHIIRFIDTNTANPALENLELVSRHELLLLNRKRYTQAPPEIQPTLRMMAKVEAVMFEKIGAMQ